MKIINTFLLFLFLSPGKDISAQQSTAGTGYITEIATGIPQKVNYSVTQKNKDDKFVTNYVISDKNQNPVKGIAVINNKKQKSIDISIIDLSTGAEETSYKVPYNLYGGLLINEYGDSVVSLEKPFNYRYLLSFDNERKEFVNLHFISKVADYNIMISIVSDTVIKTNAAMLREATLVRAVMKEQEEKQNNEEAMRRKVDSLAEVKAMAMVEAKMKQMESQKEHEVIKTPKDTVAVLLPGTDAFNAKLISMATDFYSLFHSDSLTALDCKNRINIHLQNMGNDKMVQLEQGSSDFEQAQYAGDNKNGVPEGKGILTSNKSIYFGSFHSGKFMDGDALIREKTYSYTGHFLQGKYGGIGHLELSGKGGGMQLGTFINGSLDQGIVRSSNESTRYFGQSKSGMHQGFGQSASTNIFFIGEFKQGLPFMGYSKVIDEHHNITYYGFNNGYKIPLSDPQMAKPVFDALDKLSAQQ